MNDGPAQPTWDDALERAERVHRPKKTHAAPPPR